MVDASGVPISPLFAIVAASTVLAWAIARGWWSPQWPFYRPLAILLSWWCTASIVRAAVQSFILHPARLVMGPEPYPWPARGAFLADVAVRLSWPFAILATCLAVYSRRPWWPAAAAWLVCSTVIAVAYPELRGPPLLLVEAGIATACWLACAWSAWRSFRAGDVWIASHMALVPVLGAQVAMLLSVGWWPDPTRDWWIARLVQGVGYMLLLAYQLQQIRRNSARTR